ncbi:MAG: hypothetical protein MUP90_18550, partial [Gammaproteobacteria bacterium]|nr:hypothetical protein [Gammaproteobacteria bacterium]
PGSDQWFIAEMVPGSHPLEELERDLTGIATNPNLNLQEQLAKDSFGLLRAAWMALPSKESELLLVIDQFEELFILVTDESERAHFLELLHMAVTNKDNLVRVIITLRADFYDRPLMYPDFSTLMQKRTVVVVPLTPEELEQAVEAPASRVGAVLEKGLVGAISADVADQPGALPLLQYALTELFERREGRMLTGEAYLSIGGVLGALGRRAEEVYGGLDEGGRDVARQIFLRLVTLGDGVEDTRRRVLRSELEGLIRDSEQGVGDVDQGIGDRGMDSVISNQKSTINNVIDAFGEARLLSFDRDPVTRAPTVEVAHEALLNEWRRLREWLDESRADIRMQRVLGYAASDWLESGKEASFLLRGSRLDQFEGWADTTDLALTQGEQDYLQTCLEERRSREAEEAQRQAREAALEKRSRNFLRVLAGVLAVAAIVAVALSVFAFSQRGEAQNNAATAQAEAFARATQQSIAEEETDARATQQAVAEQEAEARATAEAQALDDRDRAVSAEQDALEQASIGLASQSELQMTGPNPERGALLALEAIENYPYTWQAEHALGQAVLDHKLLLDLRHGA